MDKKEDQDLLEMRELAQNHLASTRRKTLEEKLSCPEKR